MLTLPFLLLLLFLKGITKYTSRPIERYQLSGNTTNFFSGKDYDVGTINSHLKRSKLGYSQARKCYRDGNSRSVRVIILYTTAFTEDELHSILRSQCVFFCKGYIVTQPTVTPFPPPKTSHLPNTHRSLFFKAVSD